MLLLHVPHPGELLVHFEVRRNRCAKEAEYVSKLRESNTAYANNAALG